MRVLYVSKASWVAAHRDKVVALAGHAQVTLLIPERWGRSPAEAGAAQDQRAHGYRVERVPAVLHGHNHFHVYRGLGRVLTPGAFDLVHVDEEPYSLATAQVVRRARQLEVPSLFFAWQNLDKRLPPPFGALRRAVFRGVSGGIAGSEEAAGVLRRRGFAKPLAVIPQMGVDPERFRPDAAARQATRRRLGVQEGAFLAGFAGRLMPEKGVDLLVDALAELPGVRSVVIGGGPERGALVRRAAKRGVEGRVHFAGEVPSLEMASWLAALDCLVLPSRTTPSWKEQFGRVLVEAMACGVPVLGSDSGEIPRVIGDGGRVFREGDSRALAQEIRSLAEQPAFSRALGAGGRARVLREFTQEKVASDTAAFYRALLAPHGRACPPAQHRDLEPV